MAALSCGSKTYTGVSLIEVRYFRALCVIASPVEGFEIQGEGKGGAKATYTVTVTDTKPYNIMQQVFESANG